MVILRMKTSYRPTLRTWIHLLEVSSRFVFAELRNTAISVLTGLKDGPNGITPAHKIALALKFDIAPWLKPAYVEIVASTETIEVEVAVSVPLTILLLLTRSREIYWAHDNWVQAGSPIRGADQIVDERILRMGIDLVGRMPAYVSLIQVGDLDLTCRFEQELRVRPSLHWFLSSYRTARFSSSPVFILTVICNSTLNTVPDVRS